MTSKSGVTPLVDGVTLTMSTLALEDSTVNPAAGHEAGWAATAVEAWRFRSSAGSA
jgi:hypothetical protein